MKRQCGSCSMCCKLMGVPEVKKEHEWCPHADPGGKGCTIYLQRPERCRDFHCMWLLSPTQFPEYWFPAKAKIVVNTLIEHGASYVAFIVDPAYPNRWREKPYFSDIKAIAAAGIKGRLGKKWTTVISIKGEKIPVIGSERLLRAAG